VIVDLLAEYIKGIPHPADDVSEARWFSPEEIKNIDATISTIELLRKLDFLI
jgi:hypothetical protein